MLLASIYWAFPTPVQAQTKTNLPEVKIETNQEVKEPYGPVSQAIKEASPETVRVLPKPKPAKAASSIPNTPSVQPSRRNYSKEEVIQLIKDYSAQYGIPADLPLRIANCESGFNQYSKNKSSTASGVFQYLSSSWRGTNEGKAGLSVFDADANVKAAVSYIASRGHANPWNASKSCWQ